MKWIKSFMLFLCLCNSSFAQNLSDFKKVEGLSSNMVYCVMQDSKGFIWVGTDNGVSRYDGFSCKQFTKADGLSDNEVFQIHEDNKGRLWFLTYNGKPTFYSNHQFYTNNNSSLLQNVNATKNAVSFLQASDKSIWYITLDTAYCFKNEVLHKKIALSEVCTTASIFFSVQEVNNQVLLYCSNGWYNTSTNIYHSFPSNLVFSNFNTKAVTLKQQVYITKERGFTGLDLRTNSCVFFNVPDNQLILNIIPADNQYFWVCTSNHLYAFNTLLKTFTLVDDPKCGWYSFYMNDKNKHSWITSLNGGLYFKEHETNIALRSFNYATIHQLTNCFDLQWHNRKLYAGFEDGELAVWQNNEFKTIYRAKQSEAFKKVRSILPSKQGLWLAVDGLLTYYDARLEKAIEYEGATKAIAILPNENKYFALSEQVVKSNVYEGKVLSKNNMYLLSKVYNGKIRSLLSIGNDTLLMGGYEGLRCLVNDTITPLYNREYTLLNTHVTSIVQSIKDHFIVATKENGIGILTKDTCYTITKREGLNSNICNNVFVDAQGILWIATAKGINRIKYTITNNGELITHIIDYNKFAGLSYESVNDVIFLNDSLWLATNKGVRLFLEKQMLQQAPVIYIESIIVNQANVAIQDTFSFKFSSNMFRFNFGAIAFGSQRNITYRYKLKGLNDDWIETREPFAAYAYLPPGEYTFYVGSSLDTINKNTFATIHFIIHPPFWKKTWFVLPAILSASVFLFTFVLWRFKALQRKQELIRKSLQLAKEKAEYEREVIDLQQQALRLQMNPHFIFNAIYAIQGYFAVGNVTEGKKYVAGFAELLRLILDTGNSKTISIANEIKLLSHYLELLKVRRNNPFEFTISIKGSNNISLLQIPSMIVQPFVENAAIHGVAALKSGGKIDISFEIFSDTLVCIIDDNGIGRQAAKQMRIQQTHVSSGIQITEKRLHLFAESLQVTEIAHVKIVDKVNEAGIATGTKVILQIPIFK